MKKILLLALMQVFALTCLADEYKDPASNVIYTYDPANQRAEVKQGEDWIDTDDNTTGIGTGGSPDAKGDIVILDRFTVNGKEYVVDKIGECAFLYTPITSVVIPSTIKAIDFKAFAYSMLTSVTIPSSVQSIEAAAFEIPTLKTITCLIEEPIEVANICHPLYMQDMTLYVPAGSVEKYKATAFWSRFGNIMAIQTFQGYYPEGTKWTEIRLDTLKYDSWYSKVGDEWVQNFETVEYYVKGEYIDKHDYSYRCVYTNGPEWKDSLTLLLCDGYDSSHYKNSNIVSVGVLSGFGILIPAEAYQFDWSVGKGLYYEDILEGYATGEYPYYYYYGIIGEIKEGNFGGVRPLKYVDLDGKAPYDPHRPGNENGRGGRIIQGIGITEWNDGECLFGPPNPYEMFSSFDWEKYPERHYRSMLVHFERNGEVLYDVWPEKTSTGVDAIDNGGLTMAGGVYDLGGRRLPAEPERGFYIKDGNKILTK